MAGVPIGESGAGSSFDGVSSGQLQQQQQCQSGEALAEWRSLEQVENGTPSTSPPYWDSDDDDEEGPKPSELYGKNTWKIEKYSKVLKRELRSNVFEVGGYKWYILIYPQGCDVFNHISLFLCVANHDKLLPGWKHFAQFTIAVVNKDPKKSKYSDTLHRFCKKEHDWGWKKFMEVSKLSDGFNDGDTLIIKAQVQVIRERADRPFRCLDWQYRRELVRVYLTNVEQICRRFVEERRGKLVKLIEDKARWSSFCAFWMGMDQSFRRCMSQEKTESMLRVIVKVFFIEKEVTSTLVMDSLYTGLKALEAQNKGEKSKSNCLEAEESHVPIVRMENDVFLLVDDVLPLLERAAIEPLPPKDEKGPQNRTKDVAAGDEFSKDSIERDERRLTDLGCRTIEMFILDQLFCKIEVAYQEAVSLKRQEELIREEEAAWLAEIEQKGKRGAIDKEKKSKKKQGKQKRNNRKGKEKARDDKPISIAQSKIELDSYTVERKDELAAEPEMALEKSDALDDVSDVSDSVDCVPEILPEDRDVNLDTSEVHPPTEASGTSRLSNMQNGIGGRTSSLVDDSSSTCSSDSVPSVATSVFHSGNSGYFKNQKSPSRQKSHQRKASFDQADWVDEETRQPSQAVPGAGHPIEESGSSIEFLSQAADNSLEDSVVNGAEQHVGRKEDIGSLHKHVIPKAINVQARGTSSVVSPSRRPSEDIPSIAPKLDVKSESKVTKSYSQQQADRYARLMNSVENIPTSKPDAQKPATIKLTEKPYAHQVYAENEKPPTPHVTVTTDKPSIPPMIGMSRPLTAPLVSDPRHAVPAVSMVQMAPVLARSMSSAGGLGPEPTSSSSQNYVPQSYRNAIIGSSAYSQNHSTSSVVNAPPLSYAQVTGQLFPPHGSDRTDPNPIKQSYSFGMMNHHAVLQNGPLWLESPQNELYNPMQGRTHDQLSSEFAPCSSGRQTRVLADEFPHLDIINDLLDEEHVIGKVSISNSNYQSFSHGPQYSNRQFSFLGDPCMSSGLGPPTSSCGFERRQNYHHDNGFRHGYGGPGSSYDMIHQAPQRPYVNGQIDDLISNHWQMAGSDLPYVSTRNFDSYGYPYHLPEYQTRNGGINDYTVFRSSNGL